MKQETFDKAVALHTEIQSIYDSCNECGQVLCKMEQMTEGQGYGDVALAIGQLAVRNEWLLQDIKYTIERHTDNEVARAEKLQREFDSL